MTEHEEKRHDITERVSEEVVPIWIRVLEETEMDTQQRAIVRAALQKATWAGARIGANEVLAQLHEQGFEIDASVGIPNPSWDELLADDDEEE